VLIDPGPEKADWPGEVWMHPEPPHRDRLELHSLVPDRLLNRYDEAVRAYEHGLWTSAAQSARSVLEGVILTLIDELPDGGQRTPMLSELLRSLADRYDLAGPVRGVAQTLQAGGNMASHFRNSDFNQETAEAMLDMLDAFIEYLVVTPAQLERLRKLLGKG
jgi:HEPN domain-containing protein